LPNYQEIPKKLADFTIRGEMAYNRKSSLGLSREVAMQQKGKNQTLNIVLGAGLTIVGLCLCCSATGILAQFAFDPQGMNPLILIVSLPLGLVALCFWVGAGLTFRALSRRPPTMQQPLL
jgi:hypothetical protein